MKLRNFRCTADCIFAESADTQPCASKHASHARVVCNMTRSDRVPSSNSRIEHGDRSRCCQVSGYASRQAGHLHFPERLRCSLRHGQSLRTMRSSCSAPCTTSMLQALQRRV